MKKIIIISLFYNSFCISQNDKHYNFDAKANYYFELGLKEFNTKNYKTADSLFTLSIENYPSADAYFNRAICCKKLFKIDAYCYDLSTAVMFGDDGSKKLYIAECGKIDTSYYDKNGNTLNKTKYQTMEVTFKSGFENIDLTYVYDRNGKAFTKYQTLDSIGKVYYETEIQAQSKSSHYEFDLFTRKNLKYPNEIKKNGKIVYVGIRFLVFEDGSIKKIKAVGASEECQPCMKEAERIVAIMPNWIPGKIKEEPVKSYGYVTVKFDPKYIK